MTGVVFLITDFLYGGGLPAIATSVGAGLFALLWFGIPLLRGAREKS